MIKFLYWIPTILFFVIFGLILAVFHPLQVVGKAIGYQAHKTVVDVMILCINASLWVLASPPKFLRLHGALPKDKPLIVVSNHQSMFDIPAIARLFMKNHLKYIAKKKLANGIPSISYNIRHGGSITIDRKKPKEAQQLIKEMAQYLNETKRSVLIFPEGTRSWDGSMRPFKRAGLVTLLQEMPEALVIPVAINNFWKIGRYRMKPIPFAMKLSCTALPVIDRSSEPEEIVDLVEKEIGKYLQN